MINIFFVVLLLSLLQHTSCENLPLVIDNLGISMTPDNRGGHPQPAALSDPQDA
jgi:hypothetical protein